MNTNGKEKNRWGFEIMNKALKYLNNSINQDKLFDSICKDIHEIINSYNFKKAFFVRTSDVGEITVEVQDDIPSNLINELDEYFQLDGVISKVGDHIDIIYKLDKGV